MALHAILVRRTETHQLKGLAIQGGVSGLGEGHRAVGVDLKGLAMLETLLVPAAQRAPGQHTPIRCVNDESDDAHPLDRHRLALAIHCRDRSRDRDAEIRLLREQRLAVRAELQRVKLPGTTRSDVLAGDPIVGDRVGPLSVDNLDLEVRTSRAETGSQARGSSGHLGTRTQLGHDPYLFRQAVEVRMVR